MYYSWFSTGLIEICATDLMGMFWPNFGRKPGSGGQSLCGNRPHWRTSMARWRSPCSKRYDHTTPQLDALKHHNSMSLPSYYENKKIETLSPENIVCFDPVWGHYTHAGRANIVQWPVLTWFWTPPAQRPTPGQAVSKMTTCRTSNCQKICPVIRFKIIAVFVHVAMFLCIYFHLLRRPSGKLNFIDHVVGNQGDDEMVPVVEW